MVQCSYVEERSSHGSRDVRMTLLELLVVGHPGYQQFLGWSPGSKDSITTHGASL